MPIAKHPNRAPEPDHRDRYERSIDGAERIVLIDCYSKCTNCGGMFPMEMVGLRNVRKDKTLRNQARCVECRKYKK